MRLRGIIGMPPSSRRWRCASSRDPRIRPVRHDHLRSAAGSRRSMSSASAARPAPRCSPTRPNRVADLPTRARPPAAAGRLPPVRPASASPTYVISDEDLLEFICALQSEHLAPEKLFHELEHNHLLFIGSNFTNWLARLFLRMAKRQRLSDPRDVGEVLADDHTERGRAPGVVPAAGQRAHAHLRRRRAIRRTSCTGAGGAPQARAGAAVRAGAVASCRRPARCRTTRCSSATRARTSPPCRSSRRGSSRRRHDLVRHGAARGRRRLRPQDPAQHRALLLLHPGRLGGHAAPARGATSAANGATRSTARATWPTARCSCCR